MKRIGITLGDLGGIGPEIVFKFLSTVSSFDFIPIIFGSATVLEHALIQRYVEKLSLHVVSSVQAISFKWGEVYFVAEATPVPLHIGSPCAQNGHLAYRAIQQAVQAALDGVVEAIVTAPLCKESMFLAGCTHTDHTTLLAHLTGSDRVSMAFYTPRLKTVLATVHVPFTQVASLLNETTLSLAVENAFNFTQYLEIKNPKIAVAGLNPHAGESGLFGREELEVINPVIKTLAEKGVPVYGSFPPDTLYYRAYQGEFDVVVSLYHDQGLIPIKLLAFEEAVNITLGLPFVRTSPDHGTAFDIAYQGKASTTSFGEALKLALKLESPSKKG